MSQPELEILLHEKSLVQARLQEADALLFRYFVYVALPVIGGNAYVAFNNEDISQIVFLTAPFLLVFLANILLLIQSAHISAGIYRFYIYRKVNNLLSNNLIFMDELDAEVYAKGISPQDFLATSIVLFLAASIALNIFVIDFDNLAVRVSSSLVPISSGNLELMYILAILLYSSLVAVSSLDLFFRRLRAVREICRDRT